VPYRASQRAHVEGVNRLLGDAIDVASKRLDQFVDGNKLLVALVRHLADQHAEGAVLLVQPIADGIVSLASLRDELDQDTADGTGICSPIGEMVDARQVSARRCGARDGSIWRPERANLMRQPMADLHLGTIALQGALFGVYFSWRDYARRRRAERIAEGRPSIAEKAGRCAARWAYATSQVCKRM
jgi:hypothetical protein